MQLMQSLTPRRNGAKRTTESKDRRIFGHAIGHTLNAVFNQVFAEVDKETESLIHQPQIGQDLFAVDRIERGDRFHLHDHEIIDYQVSAEALVEPDSIPCDWNRYLSFHRIPMFAQFMRKQDFVYDFEDAWPEPGVQAVGSVDNQSRDFILFHAAKLGLLVPACEAKNLPNLAPFARRLPRNPTKSFSRQGAKAQRGPKHQTARFQLQTLAPWRLCVRYPARNTKRV